VVKNRTEKSPFDHDGGRFLFLSIWILNIFLKPKCLEPVYVDMVKYCCLDDICPYAQSFCFGRF